MPARAPAPPPAIDDDADAYNLPTVCRHSAAGRTTIYAEIAAGRLRAVKLGTRTLILKRDYDRWLAGLPALHADAADRPVATGRRRRANGAPGTAKAQGPIGAGAAGGGGTAVGSGGPHHRSAAS
jgi:excisionase family DNA binding protein